MVIALYCRILGLQGVFGPFGAGSAASPALARSSSQGLTLGSMDYPVEPGNDKKGEHRPVPNEANKVDPITQVLGKVTPTWPWYLPPRSL